MKASILEPMPARSLPEGVVGEDVADAAREAFLSFCRGVSEGWTKRDLASWLAGPYAAIARAVSFVEERDIDAVPAHPSLLASVDPAHISAILDPAWQDAVTFVGELAAGAGVQGLDEAFALRSVAEVSLCAGETIFIPVHQPRLRLSVRVRSLIVADFLFRPEDYRGEVHACAICGVVLLGEDAKTRGQCADHLFHSGMRPTAEGLEIGEDLLPAALRRA